MGNAGLCPGQTGRRAGHSDESGRDATPSTQYLGFRPVQPETP